MSNGVIEVSDVNFKEEVIGSDSPVLVDFWADWCAPCKMIAPILSELAVKYEGNLKVCKADIADNKDYTSEYKITAAPSILIFKNGEVKEKIVGAKTKNDFIKIIDSLL